VPGDAGDGGWFRNLQRVRYVEVLVATIAGRVQLSGLYLVLHGLQLYRLELHRWLRQHGDGRFVVRFVLRSCEQLRLDELLGGMRLALSPG
jgi:hypothetical protein